jgi:hypothetical protein
LPDFIVFQRFLGWMACHPPHFQIKKIKDMGGRAYLCWLAHMPFSKWARCAGLACQAQQHLTSFFFFLLFFFSCFFELMLDLEK